MGSSLLVNLLLNAGWTAPAWLLLVLHFVKQVSIWLFWGYLLFWAFIILLITVCLFLASRDSNEPPPHQENKNPYSSKGYKTIEQQHRN